MSSIARNLLLRLRVKRRALLRRYDDDALHKLRVALRRLRSMLRHIETDEAKALRHALGQIADTTNAARDWDTLMIRARETLKRREFRRVRTYLEENRAASHGPVLEMLRSDAWAQAVRSLNNFIAHGGFAPSVDAAGGDDITGARQQAHRAWAKVQSKEDNKNWHKMRLAIKELRYTFDSVPRDALDAPSAKMIKHCKRLQDVLGGWHDTVVHVHMVREYAGGLDREVEGELHELLEEWSRRMEREARDALDEARDFLAGKGSDLL